MNRIFKTVWNVARRALVVASEKAGIGQSRRAVRGASEPVNIVVPQRVTGNLGKRAFVLSGLPLALAGVFVLWGSPVHPAVLNDSIFVERGMEAASVNEPGAPDDEDDPEDLGTEKDYELTVMVPTVDGDWKYIRASIDEDLNPLQFDKNSLSWALSDTSVDHLYLVFGAETQWTQTGNGYETTSNLFSVGENPTDLNVNAANFPERDEIGFWGSAGNFTVEDGKTLVLFGEAPLNGSYLGEGKTGTVRDGTLTFGLPYKFSEFKDGQSSGDTGTLVLYDGANVVFQNGVYSTSRVDIQDKSNVRIVVKDSAEVVLKAGDSYAIDNLAYNDGAVGVIENVGSGSLTISGGSGSHAQGIQCNATDGGTGTISNTGAGTLKISAGSGEDAYGVGFNAYSEGGDVVTTGHIVNESTGTLQILGGSGKDSFGLSRNATGLNATGEIKNTGAGDMLIQGGSEDNAVGIGFNGHNGAHGIISNAGTGKLTIQGGTYETVSGIKYNAYGTGAKGEIRNDSSGTLTIRAGSALSAEGISVFAGNGGSGTLTNSGTLLVEGSSEVGANAVGILASGAGSVAEIHNYGGTISILGHKGSGINVCASADGHVNIENHSGTIEIQAGEEDGSYGIHDFVSTSTAAQQGGSGRIENDGIMNITGGAGSNAFGMATIGWNYEGGPVQVQAVVNNSGVMTVKAGTGKGAHGIAWAFAGNTDGGIFNKSGGTISLLGTESASAIGGLSFTDTTANFTNEGTVNMNKYAIGSLTDGVQRNSFINASTGTVNTEAEAIFEKTESSLDVASEVGLLNPKDGATDNVEVDGFGANETKLSWSIKDDWAIHSVWEDGGVLNITDVMEGSYAAQQIEAAFTEVFGTGTKLNFQGEDDWASGNLVTDAFTASIGNALIDQGYAGNIVTNFNLDNAAEDGTAQALTIGTGDGQVIKDSLGFRQIEGVSSVTVNSGKYFALIGLPAGGELVKGGAPVTLDNGTLKLGVTPAESARTDSSTAGKLETVAMKNGSKIETENMWVQVASVEGQGDVSLTETGRMHVGNMNVKGSVKNEGTLSADTLTVSGSLETSKTLKSSGTITVNSGSKLVADGYVVADKLDIKGVMIRGNNATVYTGAAAMDLLREANAEAAAEVDRVEGTAEVSTLSVLERIVAESMKKTEESKTEAGQDADKEDSSSDPVVVTSKRRVSPVLPQDAQAFAAFDAVSRIASDIERGSNADGRGLWVKLVTGESEFGVREGAKFELDSDGAMIGAEAKLTPNFKIGAAFSYLDGEIDAGRLKNDWTSYGMHAYLSYREGDFGVMGTVGWLRGTTEAERDYDADVWHAGIRTEYDLFKGERISFTPFLGARIMSGSFDGMSSQTVVNVPVGVKLAGELTTAGWTVTPALEASYIRSMGDTEAKDVRFLPENAFAGALSLKAEKGAWTGELSLRGAAGSNDYEDRVFMGKIGLKF